jgi:hypothetical protein
MKKFIISEEEKSRILGLHSNVILETKKEKITLSEYSDDIFTKLKKRFDLTSKEVDEVIEHYRDDIEMGFHDGDSINTVINSWVKDGKLKWKK